MHREAKEERQGMRTKDGIGEREREVPTRLEETKGKEMKRKSRH